MNAIFVHITTSSYHAKLLNFTNILIGYDNTFDSFIVSNKNLGISIIYISWNK